MYVYIVRILPSPGQNANTALHCTVLPEHCPPVDVLPSRQYFSLMYGSNTALPEGVCSSYKYCPLSRANTAFPRILLARGRCEYCPPVDSMPSLPSPARYCQHGTARLWTVLPSRACCPPVHDRSCRIFVMLPSRAVFACTVWQYCLGGAVFLCTVG